MIGQLALWEEQVTGQGLNLYTHPSVSVACSSEVVIHSIHDAGFRHAERMAERELNRYLRARSRRLEEWMGRGRRHTHWCEMQWRVIVEGVLETPIPSSEMVIPAQNVVEKTGDPSSQRKGIDGDARRREQSVLGVA